ncbi:MAG: FkbM family methyltransferase [Acidobacteriota bacterium]
MKRLILRSITALLKSYGYDVVKLTHASLGADDSVTRLAAHLQELLPLLGIECVIDVGANEGQYYEFLRERVGFGGRIVSFEPIPELAQGLNRRAAFDSNWTVYDCAVGSTEGIFPLKIATRSGWSSLLQKSTAEPTEVANSIAVSRVIDVNVKRLDDILTTSEPAIDPARTYLKIDSQGFDLEVLRGAERTLRSISALQTELELLQLYANTPSFVEVLEFLNTRHFQMTAAFPVWHDRTLRIGEMDAVFRNMSFSRRVS